MNCKKTSKSVFRFMIIITIIFSIILLECSFAFGIEYHNYDLKIDNVLVQQGVFNSNYELSSPYTLTITQSYSVAGDETIIYFYLGSEQKSYVIDGHSVFTSGKITSSPNQIVTNLVYDSSTGNLTGTFYDDYYQYLIIDLFSSSVTPPISQKLDSPVLYNDGSSLSFTPVAHAQSYTVLSKSPDSSIYEYYDSILASDLSLYNIFPTEEYDQYYFVVYASASGYLDSDKSNHVRFNYVSSPDSSGDNFIDWLLDLKDNLNPLKESLQDFKTIFGDVFAWLPSDIRSVVTAMFCFLLIAGVIKILH